MSTLHLVELDDEDNILDEVELDDDILAALESEDEDTELSLSDDNSRLALVELDDKGEIVAVEELGLEDDEEEEEDTELSQESESSEGDLELGAFSGFAKSGVVRNAAAKGMGLVRRVKGALIKGSAKLPSMKRLGTSPNFVKGGTGALSKLSSPVASASKRIVGLSPAGKAAVGGAAVGGAVGLAVGRRQRGRARALSLGNDLLLADKNPLLIDASARK